MANEVKCPFKSQICLCQWCEEPCNDGLNCHECRHEGKQMHNIYLCTGFYGTYPWGTRSSKRIEPPDDLIKMERGWR